MTLLKRRDILKGGAVMSIGMTTNMPVSGNVDENPFPPKKIIKKIPQTYSPLAYLEKVKDEIKSRLTFTGTTVKEVDEWGKNLRAKLWELIGENHVPNAVKPKASLIESSQQDRYTREKWELEIVPGRSMPFYILKPSLWSKATNTVLCLHGHGKGARDVINFPSDENARELIKLLNTDYALQCVKRGWCAVAPELFAFGERVDYVEDARPGFDGGCEKPFLNAIQVGKTLIGIRVKDICTLIDWLSLNGEYNLTNLSCIGLSGGGMMTMYTSALDDRIKRTLIAGYITEMKDSILAIRHCSCNYIPGLAEWADFPDVAGLIAPRLQIIQTGKKDAIFPLESVRRAHAKITDVYEVYGKPENIYLHEHDGYHSFWSPSLDTLLT